MILNQIDTAEALINLYDAYPVYKKHWEPYLRARLTALTLDHLSEVSNDDLDSIFYWQVTEFTLQKGQLQRAEHANYDGSLYKGVDESTVPEKDPISVDEYLDVIMSYRRQIKPWNTTPVMFSLQQCRILCTMLHIQGFSVPEHGDGEPMEATYDYPLRNIREEFRGHMRLYHYYKDGIYAYKNEHHVVGSDSHYDLTQEARDVEWFHWCDEEGWLNGWSSDEEDDEEDEEDGEETVEEEDDGEEHADGEESDDGAEEDQNDNDAASN